MNYKLSVMKRDSEDWLFLLMIIWAAMAPQTILSYFIIIVFCGIVMTTNFRSLKGSIYFLLEIGFILFLVFQIFTGNVVSGNVQFAGIRLVLVSLIYNFSIYNYVIKDYKKAIINYADGVLVAAVILLLFYYSSFPTSGGLDASQTKGLGPFLIGGVASVYLAWMCAIGIALTMLLYLETKNKKVLWKAVMLFFFLILTGRRKVLLFPVAIYIGGTIFRTSPKNILKKLKYVIVILAAMLGAWIAIMKIPVLYDFIGKRLVDAFNYVVLNLNTMDSSLRARQGLLIKARQAWENNKLYGSGYGSFQILFNNGGYYTHSNYWELLVAGGIIGCILYYLKYLLIIVALLRKNKVWQCRYLLVILLCFMILEQWQITFIYRSLSIFIVFCCVYAERICTGNGK